MPSRSRWQLRVQYRILWILPCSFHERMASQSSNKRETTEQLPLSKAAEYLLDESRMVLPGIQALFGFQLIAVFNSAFEQKLSPAEQRGHLLAIGFVAI